VSVACATRTGLLTRRNVQYDEYLYEFMGTFREKKQGFKGPEITNKKPMSQIEKNDMGGRDDTRAGVVASANCKPRHSRLDDWRQCRKKIWEGDSFE
jgi:hypothetical protein